MPEDKASLVENAHDPNRVAIDSFLDECAAHLGTERPAMQEKCEHTMEVFRSLHEAINDPLTRETQALKKAELIFGMVLAEFDVESVEDLAGRGILLEIISQTDPITQTLTHNVVVTFGNPQSGPNTLLEVHLDTIAAPDHELKTQGDKLVGRTVQDDTIHAAAVLTSLSDIQVPESGAITVVFSDHEENGCRGSSALLSTLLERVSADYPVACVALESTEGQLALGHRGKFSGSVVGGPISSREVVSVATDICRQLSYNQRQAFEDSGDSSLLGKTVGTSTFGEVSTEKVEAKLDFRTTEVVTAEQVENQWNDLSRATQEAQLVQRAKEQLESGSIQISIHEGQISIQSDSKKLHPSEFDPTHDETVIPVLYLLLRTLELSQSSEKVTSVIWGSKEKQNSNPMIANISGDWEGLNAQDLIQQMLTYTPSEEPLSATQKLSLTKTDKTDCVVSPQDEVVDQIVRDCSAMVGHPMRTTTKNFMTDIGRAFNAFKNRGQRVYGFVYGVGDSSRLHGVEEVGVNDLVELVTVLEKLPNSIQSKLK